MGLHVDQGTLAGCYLLGSANTLHFMTPARQPIWSTEATARHTDLMQHSMLVLLYPGHGVLPQRYGQAPVQHIPVCFPLRNLLTRRFLTFKGSKHCAARQRMRAAAAQTAGVAIEEHASFNCATLNILAPIYKRTARCTCIMLCMSTCLSADTHQHHHALLQRKLPSCL